MPVLGGLSLLVGSQQPIVYHTAPHFTFYTQALYHLIPCIYAQFYMQSQCEKFPLTVLAWAG